MITDFKQLHTFCRENNIPYKVESEALSEGVAPLLHWAFENNKKNIYESALTSFTINSEEKHKIVYGHFFSLSDYAHIYKDAHLWLDIVLQHHTKDNYQDFFLKKILENSVANNNSKLMLKTLKYLQHDSEIDGLALYFCIKCRNEQLMDIFLKKDVPLVIDKMMACKVDSVPVSPFYVSLVEEALFGYASPRTTVNKLIDYFKKDIDANDYMGYLIKCVNNKDIHTLQLLWNNTVFQNKQMNFTPQDLINDNIDYTDTNSQFKYGHSYLQTSLEMVNDLQYYDYFMSIGFDVKDVLNNYARIALRDNDIDMLHQLKDRNHKINDKIGNLIGDAIRNDYKEVAQFLMMKAEHHYYIDYSLFNSFMRLNVDILSNNQTVQYILDNAPENFVQNYLDKHSGKYDEQHHAWLLGEVLKREALVHNPDSLQRKKYKKI